MSQSAQSVSTIGQLQLNLLYKFQNFQNSELNGLPISELYFLITNPPSDESSSSQSNQIDIDSMRSDIENSIKNSMKGM